MKNSEIRFSELKREDFDKQLKLFNETFGREMSEKQWNIKHSHNPYTSKSENFALYDGDELIGFNLFMPQEYIINGEKKLLLQSCESAVDVGYRGQGRLLEILLKSEEILKKKYDLIYGLPNQNSQKTFEKAGYTKKSDINLMIGLGNKRKIIGDLTRALMHKKNIGENMKKFSEKGEKVKVASYKDFQYNECYDENEISINKNKVMYQWKLSNISEDDCKVIYIENNGQTEAYAVVQYISRGRARRVRVLDISIKNDRYDDMKKILKYIKNIGSVVEIMVVKNGILQEKLKKMGFKVLKKNTSCLMYKIINSNGDLSKETMEDKNWEFQLVEIDTIFN